MRDRGLNVRALHGDMTQGQRDGVMLSFKGGRVPILVATDVAARGLDISTVTHVVNFDVPVSPDVYVHRIGRTGRVGRSGRAITFVEPRQTMFFSATLDGEVGELARRYTHFPARFEGELPAERRTGEIDHRFVAVTTETKVSTLVELLKHEERGLALVFVRTKAGADRLVEKLHRHDVEAAAIHGDKGQAQRERALSRFDAGKVRTLVATDVAARGLDVDDITHVINFDPPDETDGYTHRVGRTGRAGRGGVGITLVLPEQQADVSRVARLQGHVERFEESGMQVAKPRVVYTSRRRGARSKW